MPVDSNRTSWMTPGGYLPDEISEFADIRDRLALGKTMSPAEIVEDIEQVAYAYLQESTENTWDELLVAEAPVILFLLLTQLFAPIRERFRIITGWREAIPFTEFASKGHIAGVLRAAVAGTKDQVDAQEEVLVEVREMLQHEYMELTLALGEYRRSLARQPDSRRPIEIVIAENGVVISASVYGRAANPQQAPAQGIRFLATFKQSKNSILPKDIFATEHGIDWQEAVTELCNWLRVADRERIIHDFAAEGTINLSNELFLDIR